MQQPQIRSGIEMMSEKFESRVPKSTTSTTPTGYIIHTDRHNITCATPLHSSNVINSLAQQQAVQESSVLV